jgi:beta-1,4-mannosyl-glycoprotein beta-1,4-N-acetylglucosaminyltransferase
MKVFDCFIFFNELDILEIRLNELDPVVDHFVLVEARKTHTGQEKPLHYLDNKDRFAAFRNKLIHVVVDDFPANLAKGVEASYYQRERIADGLASAGPQDLIMVSDADEIPSATAIEALISDHSYRRSLIYFELPVYHFKLNWRVYRKKRQFNTRIIEMRNFNGAQHLRFSRALISRSLPKPVEQAAWNLRTLFGFGKLLERKVLQECGWHFSFMFDKAGIREKIRAYGHYDRETADNLSDEALERHFRERQSMWGDTIVPVPLEALPLHVRRNVDRFAHLLDLGPRSDR